MIHPAIEVIHPAFKAAHPVLQMVHPVFKAAHSVLEVHYPVLETTYPPLKVPHPFAKTGNVPVKAYKKAHRGEPQRDNRDQFKTNVHGPADFLSVEGG
ncbi:MAG: hypothetical protein OXJ38_04170 [Gammaproteobacteria bacterium]|nr:hypothetical protein [Gammaproteobacteria bacterium]